MEKENKDLQEDNDIVSIDNSEAIDDNDSYIRLAADFENYKKRVQKEKIDIINNTKIKTLESIFNIDNDINIALNHLKSEEAIEGFNLLSKKIEDSLRKEGIERIQTDDYNVDLHEVIYIAKSDKDNTILSVISNGYTLDGKPFRYPKIVLGKININ